MIVRDEREERELGELTFPYVCDGRAQEPGQSAALMTAMEASLSPYLVKLLHRRLLGDVFDHRRNSRLGLEAQLAALDLVLVCPEQPSP